MAAAVAEPEFLLDKPAKMGTGILKPHQQLLHPGGKNGDFHLKTIGETVDEPLNLLIKKKPQFFGHGIKIPDNCTIVHVFFLFRSGGFSNRNPE
jgi:hypothetical protein